MKQKDYDDLCRKLENLDGQHAWREDFALSDFAPDETTSVGSLVHYFANALKSLEGKTITKVEWLWVDSKAHEPRTIGYLRIEHH